MEFSKFGYSAALRFFQLFIYPKKKNANIGGRGNSRLTEVEETENKTYA